jgi:hypothetical protein
LLLVSGFMRFLMYRKNKNPFLEGEHAPVFRSLKLPLFPLRVAPYFDELKEGKATSGGLRAGT